MKKTFFVNIDSRNLFIKYETKLFTIHRIRQTGFVKEATITHVSQHFEHINSEKNSTEIQKNAEHFRFLPGIN